MKIKIFIGLSAVVIFIIGAVVIINKKTYTPIENNPIQNTPVNNTNTSTTKTNTEKIYTMVDVQKHNSQSSCWTAINGAVYDVTSWISQHPGGAGAILSLCGKDGSSAFNDQHGGQRRPEQELASFKIGVLK
ncbi:cytochrome b5 domain-containing protein [Candidatus Nomurabacteria bacterium]|nr:cytochrome b5 domain-containing protein [Candidatus Nomurabacteria bacterium]